MPWIYSERFFRRGYDRSFTCFFFLLFSRPDYSRRARMSGETFLVVRSSAYDDPLYAFFSFFPRLLLDRHLVRSRFSPADLPLLFLLRDDVGLIKFRSFRWTGVRAHIHTRPKKRLNEAVRGTEHILMSYFPPIIYVLGV